ncbi:MAG: response regulator transcription factor [Pseudomonadota bacterium]
MRLLIVEDDKDAASYLVKGLTECGHVTDHAADGDAGLDLALTNAYDALVIDRMLPKRDGLSIIAELRKTGNTTPVLILSALDAVDERVEGLAAGGDDYLTKPYALNELIARLEALVRRAHPEHAATLLHVGDLKLDLLKRKVTRDGTRINLQPREFRLLEYLMRHAGQVVTRTMLLENVWDYHFDPQTNVIDVQISRLRSKIDKDFGQSMLQTVRGAGYRLVTAE